jgi:hypothetical protein
MSTKVVIDNKTILNMNVPSDSNDNLDEECSSLPSSQNENNENDNDNTSQINSNINIFRYNFDDVVMGQLTAFAKVHQHDDRKTYKESWKLWLEENEDLVKGEITRLNELGYKGDVIDKMYKSARYYFRKKSNVKPDPKKRRKYISMEHELITAMDNHIIRNMNNDEYTPSSGYSKFCPFHIEIIRSEINRMLEIGISTEDISLKFKKTYKNRYFIISRNNLNN